MGKLRLEHVMLDVNGTMALDGKPIEGVAERLRLLAARVSVLAITAATHGRLAQLREALGVPVEVIERGREAEQKRDRVVSLGAGGVAAIGNGANDALMLQEAALGIVVLGPEGAARAAALAADVWAGDVREALDLLARPDRLVATLRR